MPLVHIALYILNSYCHCQAYLCISYYFLSYFDPPQDASGKCAAYRRSRRFSDAMHFFGMLFRHIFRHIVFPRFGAFPNPGGAMRA